MRVIIRLLIITFSLISLEIPVTAQNGEEESIETLRAKCDGGRGWACNDLSTKYYSASYRTESERRENLRASLFYEKKSCDLNDFGGCHNLGVWYFEGQIVGREPARAVSLWIKACDGGYLDSCLNLGNSYYNGQGVAQDAAKAVTLYNKVCFAKWGNVVLGGPQACNNLGNSYFVGKGVAEDNTRAAGLYKMACDAGNNSGCGTLGFMYQEGLSLPKNVVQAAALYKKACDGGVAQSCTRLENLPPVPGQVLAPPIDCSSFPFTRIVTVPTESSGKNAVCQTIAKNLGTNQFRFISFIKTDGQTVEVFGVRGYSMFYSAEIEYTSDLRIKCGDEKHFLDEDCVSEISVGGYSIRGNKLPRAAKSGARVKRSGIIKFERYEGGWKWLTVSGVE